MPQLHVVLRIHTFCAPKPGTEIGARCACGGPSNPRLTLTAAYNLSTSHLRHSNLHARSASTTLTAQPTERGQNQESHVSFHFFAAHCFCDVSHPLKFKGALKFTTPTESYYNSLRPLEAPAGLLTYIMHIVGSQVPAGLHGLCDIVSAAHGDQDNCGVAPTWQRNGGGF